MPRHKATKTELAERIDLAAQMIIAGWRDGEIKVIMFKRYGVAPRTVHRYMARARKDLTEETAKPRTEHVADAIARYQSIFRDSKTSANNRLKAQERIDKLLGLEHQFTAKVEVSGPGGNPIEVAATRDSIKHILADPEAHAAAARLGGLIDRARKEVPVDVAASSSAE